MQQSQPFIPFFKLWILEDLHTNFFSSHLELLKKPKASVKLWAKWYFNENEEMMENTHLDTLTDTYPGKIKVWFIMSANSIIDNLLKGTRMQK